MNLWLSVKKQLPIYHSTKKSKTEMTAIVPGNITQEVKNERFLIWTRNTQEVKNERF